MGIHDEFLNKLEHPKHGYYRWNIAKILEGEYSDKRFQATMEHFELGAIPWLLRDTVPLVSLLLGLLPDCSTIL